MKTEKGCGKECEHCDLSKKKHYINPDGKLECDVTSDYRPSVNMRFRTHNKKTCKSCQDNSQQTTGRKQTDKPEDDSSTKTFDSSGDNSSYEVSRLKGKPASSKDKPEDKDRNIPHPSGDSLSDKRKEILHACRDLVGEEKSLIEKILLLVSIQDKEAIKKLKEEIQDYFYRDNMPKRNVNVQKKINKIFGDVLTDKFEVKK